MLRIPRDDDSQPIDTKDVNGEEIRRGDWVRLSVAMVVLDGENGKLGTGQVIHVFSDGIHVTFPNGEKRVGNSGLCFEKVSNHGGVL